MPKIIAQKEGRLDKFLQQSLNQPRNQVENFIKDIGVNVDGKIIKKCGFKLKGGEEIEYVLPTEELDEVKSVDFDVEILYEDDDLLVINKPPNLVIHSAPSVKEPTLVDWLKYKGVRLSTISGEERNGIVHRIDKETSGALVVAKNNESHRHLSKQLEDRSMGRYYVAIIDLALKDDLIIDKPIARDKKYRTRMSIDNSGKDAKSAFVKLLSSNKNSYELIACKLFSGRTHQIRVHLKSISRHILADTLYGFKSKKDNIKRVMLHAKMIYFIHPKSGKKFMIEAPLFDDFKDLLEKNFNKEEIDEKLSSNYIISRFDFAI